MTRVNDDENSKVLAVCFEDYRASLNSGAAGVRDEVDLYHIHLDLLNRASMAYMSSAVNPIQSHFSQLTVSNGLDFIHRPVMNLLTFVLISDFKVNSQLKIL